MSSCQAHCSGKTSVQCRVLLHKLAEEALPEGQELTLSSRGRPYCWINGQPDHVTAAFPIYLKKRTDDALLTTFAQVWEDCLSA